MDIQNINSEIATLPPEAQRQAFDFIAFLKSRYKIDRPVKKAVRNKIASDPFIGIWEGRKEMKDSSQWVRNASETEWIVS